MTEGASSLRPAMYDELVRFRDEMRDDTAPATQVLADVATELLNREARLLDHGRYDEWLELFTDDCVYWVPHDTDSDPRQEVAYLVDDRRRIIDRLAWMRTGWAHAQTPPTRTMRTITNVEVRARSTKGELALAATGVTWAWRKHELLAHPARLYYLAVDVDGEWRIRFRIVHRLDADGAVRNLAFIL